MDNGATELRLDPHLLRLCGAASVRPLEKVHDPASRFADGSGLSLNANGDFMSPAESMNCDFTDG